MTPWSAIAVRTIIRTKTTNPWRLFRPTSCVPFLSSARRPRPARPKRYPGVSGLAGCQPTLKYGTYSDCSFKRINSHVGARILDRPAWSADGLQDPDNPLLRTDRSDARTSSHRRSEEHTSELQSLMRISYAVFCLKKK